MVWAASAKLTVKAFRSRILEVVRWPLLRQSTTLSASYRPPQAAFMASAVPSGL